MDKYAIDGHKMQYHIDRTAQWLAASTPEQKLKVFPIYIEISPVGHCNHRCTFCAVDYIGYKPRFLDKEKLKDALTQMGKNGVRSVMFAGEGEPLLYKNLPEVIQHAKKSGIDVSITTNGVLLTESFVRECLHDVSWIKVSLNGGTRDVYTQVHQAKEGDFDKVWKNLAFACEHRDRTGGTTALGVQSVMLPENIHTVEELVAQAKRCGLEYVVLKPYSQHLMSLTQLYKDIKYGNTEQMALELAKHNSDKFEVVTRYISMRHWDEEDRGYDKCSSTPYFWAYIMATGDVYGCSAYLLDERFCYGNIHEQTFDEVWTGPKRAKAIDFVENALDIRECRKNCRMDKINRYLWDIRKGHPHASFI